MLRAVALFFSGLAAVGFAASLVEHVAALMGHQGPLGSGAMWLHVGIFVVAVPAVFASSFLVYGAPRCDRWSTPRPPAEDWSREVRAEGWGDAPLRIHAAQSISRSIAKVITGRDTPR